MLLDSKQIKNLAQKLPVRAVTTAALAGGGVAVYAVGTLGFGATLTAFANSALDVIDGVTLLAGERVLVKNEVAGLGNGIYVVTNLGSVGTKWVLTRASDADTNVKVFPGISVFSTADGTANASKEWVLNTTTVPLVIGTTVQTWASQSESNQSVATSSNKSMAASATTADFQSACATTMASTPVNDGYVQVFVNGFKQVLGDGLKTKDCYFSSDGGVTAKSIANIAAGDTLYWVGSVASYQLAATDIIDFDYV